MSTLFPDAATMRTALALAIRAPSVHNIQPWQWRVGADSLHLYADPARHLVHTDPDGRDLFVSCGATLHHCVVALAALGWHSRIRRFPNPAEPAHLAAIELQRHPAGEVDITLAAAIPRRRNDRRYYSPWPVSHGDISLMGARAARMGIVMRRVQPTTVLRAALAQAIWQHASVAGGPVCNTTVSDTPVSDPESPAPGRLCAGTTPAQPPHAFANDDGGVLLALGTVADDDLARLRAGEASSLVLLTATALGLASCPVTEPLEVAQTRDTLRDDAFDEDGFPQMLLRVGWAPVDADPLPPTPRRPLDEVVTRLD